MKDKEKLVSYSSLPHWRLGILTFFAFISMKWKQILLLNKHCFKHNNS